MQSHQQDETQSEQNPQQELAQTGVPWRAVITQLTSHLGAQQRAS